MNSLKPEERDQIREGLHLIKYLQKVIVLAQQHRGMTNTLMQGNESLKPEMLAVQTALDHLASNKSRKNARIKTQLKVFPEWKLAAKTWPKLRDHSLSGDWPVHTLFREHNVLIARLLTLLEDITQHYQLHELMLDRVTHALTVCVHTLRAAEHIAQLRGMGSGVSASGVVGESDKLMLDYLRNTVEESTDLLFGELGQIASPFLKKQLAMSVQSIRDSLNNLLNFIDQMMDDQVQSNMTTKQFFNMATTPIDGLLVVFNLILNTITEQYAVAV